MKRIKNQPRKGVVSVRMTSEQFDAFAARAEFFGRTVSEQARHSIEADLARPMLKVNGSEASTITLRVA